MELAFLHITSAMKLTSLYIVLISVESIDYVSALFPSGQVCPNKFAENSNFVSTFHRYCNRYSFSLTRIQTHFREDTCFSKCATFETCAYYMYDVINTQCVVCLRDRERFGELNVGSELVEYSAIPSGSVFMRTGM